MTFPYFSSVFTGLVLLANLGLANTVISTFPDQDATIGSFGLPDSGSTPTYGQVFKVPSSSILQSVRFSISNPNDQAVPYQMYVYRWDGSGISGNALYTSSIQSIAPTAGTYTYSLLEDMQLALTPGDNDIALFSTIGFSGLEGDLRFETAPAEAYLDGTFAFSNVGAFEDLPGSWGYDVFGNLAFEMKFTDALPVSSAPEPASFGLLACLAIPAAFWRSRVQHS